MSALHINLTGGIFIGDIFGLLLAIPISLFLAYWLSSVKSKFAVVIGAFIGAMIGFLTILGWASTVPDVNPAAVFFGSVIFCATLGLVAAMLIDLLVARAHRHDYRRRATQE